MRAALVLKKNKREKGTKNIFFYLEIYSVIQFILKYTLTSKGLVQIEGSLSEIEGSLRVHQGKPFFLIRIAQLRLRLNPFHNSLGKHLENILH